MFKFLARLCRIFVGSRSTDSSALLPTPTVGKLSDNSQRWRTFDEGQPALLVERTFAPGWFKIFARIQVECGAVARLYYDCGDGFNETQSVALMDAGSKAGGSGFIHTRRPIRALRFVPAPVPTDFTVFDFSIQPLSDMRMLAEALRWKYRDMSTRRNFARSLKYGLGLLLKFNFKEFRQKLFPPEASNTQQSYDVWCAKHALTPQRRVQLAAEAATWANPPLITVVLPVYNVPETYLRKALDSVLAQIYPHWELCVADDRSSAPHVRKVLEEYRARDARIKIVYRETNGHISAASNSALALATGEFCATLDHDDELTPHALFEVARVLVADPALDFIYSDEDKLDLNGRRIDPFFKPDWSPEYFLACMYTCHLGVYRTALLRELGGFRSEFDTAQDYDLVLRVIEKTRRIHHIPDVLYHWRMLPTSTASGSAAKPKAHLIAQAALRAHLERTGAPGSVEAGPSTGFHRVRYAIRGRPKISIFIASACNSHIEKGVSVNYLERLIESIFSKSTWRNFEIIVLDRQRMSPRMQKRCAEWGVRRIAYDDEFNYARVANRGARAATGEYILLLNDDMEVLTPDWLEALLEFAQQDGVGAVGAQLIFPDERLQHTGVSVIKGGPGHPYYCFPKDYPGYFFSNAVHRNWLAVTGACLMTRKDVYHSLGGFNEAFALNYNDVDYCLKLVASGRRIVYTPYAQLYHFESVSRPRGIEPAEVKLFRELWLARFPRDPYCNPNLTIENGAFVIGQSG